MKSIILTITILLVSNIVISQHYAIDERRYISVTGSAEVVVYPDEIELEILLHEYNTSHGAKIDLKSIESKFFNILEKNNINQNQLEFGNSNYYWYHWWSYRNDIFKKKTYKVKLNSSTDFLSLVKDLDFEGVNSLRISNSSNAELQQLRKDIKISALKAAKEKAMYLLESIDEKVGKIISVEEVPENTNYYWRRNQNILSNAKISRNASSEDVENVATIKLRYEVKTKFEIE